MKLELNKKFNLEEIIKMEKDIDFFRLRYNEEQDFLDSLDNLFTGQNDLYIYEHRYDYSRWWSIITWQRLNELTEDKVENFFAKQILEIILFLDRDIVKDLMWYLSRDFYVDILSIVDFYGKIKKAFLNSEAVLGTRENGEYYTLKDLVQDVEFLESNTSDAIKNAELYTKVEKILFPIKKKDFNEQYVTQPYGDIITNLIDLINFFLGVDEQKIDYVVNSFIEAVSYNVQQTEKKAEADDEKEIISKGNIQDKKVEDKKEERQNTNTTQLKTEEEKLPSTSTPVTEVFKDEAIAEKRQETKQAEKVDYNLIKMDIESNFEMDDNADFINLDGVLKRLEELKEKYNDEKISDLYYYDEGQDKFIWNDELLNS